MMVAKYVANYIGISQMNSYGYKAIDPKAIRDMYYRRLLLTIAFGAKEDSEEYNRAHTNFINAEYYYMHRN